MVDYNECCIQKIRAHTNSLTLGVGFKRKHLHHGGVSPVRRYLMALVILWKVLGAVGLRLLHTVILEILQVQCIIYYTVQDCSKETWVINLCQAEQYQC